MESILNNLIREKPQSPESFDARLYQTFKEEMISTLHNLYQKIEAEKTYLN